MALVGVFGVFLVFKLQQLSVESELVYDRLKDFVRDYFLAIGPFSTTISVNYYDAQSLLQYFRSLAASENKGYLEKHSAALSQKDGYIKLSQQFASIIESRARILEDTKKGILYILSIIVISLFGMLFIVRIHYIDRQLEFLLIVFTIALNIAALFFTLNFVFRVIKR